MLTITAQALRLQIVGVRESMKSAKIISPRKFVVIDEDVPSPDSDKILVRLLKTAICGSDLPYFNNSFNPQSYPFPSGYPGHECMGIVEHSPNGRFRPGERVMYYPVFLDGFKEYHIADPSRLQKLPDDGNADVLLITQLLGAVSHAMFRIDNPSGKTVIVLGAGPVGLLFIALLKNFGARNIIAVDPLEYRLKTAAVMGADRCINPSTVDTVSSVKNITGNEYADIVIDAYGQDTRVINTAFDCAKHGAQVVFFGICLEESPKLNFNVFFRKELRMISCVGPVLSVDYPYALDMILKKAVDVTPLITHVLPFGEIQKGFELAVNREDNVIKVILEF